MKITVDIDIQDIIDDSIYNENKFKEEFADTLRYEIVEKLKEQCKDAILKQIQNPITERLNEVANKVAKELLAPDLATQKFEFKINYSTEYLTIKEYIEKYIGMESERKVTDIVKGHASMIVNEMRKRYDMTFAALIVDNMRKQNLLADDRLAELLATNNK